MKVKFKGAPGEDLKSINMYGTEFPVGKSVDVSKLPHNVQRKLANHAQFEATGKDVEDVQFTEVKYDSQRDGALQAVNLQAEHDIAVAELQGKQPAPNAKEGLVPDVAEGPTVQDVSPAAQAAEKEAQLKADEKRARDEFDAMMKAEEDQAAQDEADMRQAALEKAEAMGIKVDKRWSTERLQAAVADKAKK